MNPEKRYACCTFLWRDLKSRPIDGTSHWNIFEWDHADWKRRNVQHLRDHGIEPHEAEECFSHMFLCNKDRRRLAEVYVLDGRTDRGRWLRLVFEDKGHGVVRVFTGWDLRRKKN